MPSAASTTHRDAAKTEITMVGEMAEDSLEQGGGLSHFKDGWFEDMFDEWNQEDEALYDKHGEKETLFTCFPKFPPEIREIIWKEALQVPGTIQFEERPSGDKRCVLQRNQGTPALLHVNIETRILSLQVYQRIQPDSPIFINFSVDCLKIEDTKSYARFLIAGRSCYTFGEVIVNTVHEDLCLHLKHVIIEDTQTFRSNIFAFTLKKISQCLLSLKTVTVNKSLLENVGTLSDCKFTKEDQVGAYFTAQWKKYGRKRKVPDLIFE